MGQIGKNVGQVLSGQVQCLLRGFCTLCSSGTCLALKEIARSDRRSPSQPGAPRDSRHITWLWVLWRKQNEVGTGQQRLLSRGRTGWQQKLLLWHVPMRSGLRVMRWHHLVASEMNKVPARGDALSFAYFMQESARECGISCRVSSSLVYFP